MVGWVSLVLAISVPLSSFGFLYVAQIVSTTARAYASHPGLSIGDKKKAPRRYSGAGKVGSRWGLSGIAAVAAALTGCGGGRPKADEWQYFFVDCPTVLVSYNDPKRFGWTERIKHEDGVEHSYTGTRFGLLLAFHIASELEGFTADHQFDELEAGEVFPHGHFYVDRTTLGIFTVVDT